MPDIENVIPLTEIPKQDNPVATDWVLGTHNNNTVTNRFQISALKSIISPIDSVDTDNLTISNRQLTIASDAGTKTKMIALDTSISNLETADSNIITSAFGNTSSIYKTLDGIAKKVGYDVSRTPSTFDNSTYVYTLSITRNNDKTDPADISTWAQSLITDFYGSGSSGTPTKDSSGHWNWTPNAISALSVSVANQPNYIKAFKSNIFDNNWTANKSYSIGTVVVYDNKLYKCKSGNSSSTFNPNNWDLLSGGGGGGGLPADGWEQWKDLFEGVVNGLTRALDIHEGWRGPGSEDEITGTWSSELKANFGYDYNSDTIPKYDSNTLTDEALLDNSGLRFRGKILETLKNMIDGYEDLISKTGLYTNSFYQNYVCNGSSNAYNANADLMLALLKFTQPKVVTGVFEAKNWTAMYIEQDGYSDTYGNMLPGYEKGFFVCPLTQINNPNNVSPLMYGYDDSTSSSLHPRNSLICKKVIMSLNESFSEEDTIEDDQQNLLLSNEKYIERITNLRKEYNKILMHNLQDNIVTINNVQRVLDPNDSDALSVFNPRPAYNSFFNYANGSGVNAWQGVEAVTAINEDCPNIDIPVKFLVFPPCYDIGAIT